MHLIRNEMEAILLGQPVNQFEDIASYQTSTSVGYRVGRED